MDKLEQMVDKFGLYAIAAELAVICDAKAEHIRSNWQDTETARPWGKAAKVFDRAHASLERIQGLQS